MHHKLDTRIIVMATIIKGSHVTMVKIITCIRKYKVFKSKFHKYNLKFQLKCPIFGKDYRRSCQDTAGVSLVEVVSHRRNQVVLYMVTQVWMY